MTLSAVWPLGYHDPVVCAHMHAAAFSSVLCSCCVCMRAVVLIPTRARVHVILYMCFAYTRACMCVCACCSDQPDAILNLINVQGPDFGV